MKSRRPKRNTVLLILLIIFAGIYCGLLFFNLPLSTNRKVDGIIGVLYGLFTASHPAANVLDLLFFSRSELRAGLSKRAYAMWWGLNGLVLVAGWFAIVFGLIRFTAR
jgi:hypothetical protein